MPLKPGSEDYYFVSNRCLCRSETASDGMVVLRRVPLVLAQQPAQPVAPPDRPLPTAARARHRCPLAQPLVRARLVVVGDVDAEHLVYSFRTS